MFLPSFRITLVENSGFLKQIRNGALRRDFHATAVRKSCGSKCEGSDRKIEMDPGCKVAIVTGGATGIGFGIASHLLKSGAKCVAITGLDICKGKDAVHKLNSAFGKNKAMFINSNVTCMVQFEETFKTVKDMFKSVDIVVNCAGIIDGKNWEREIVTNVIGTIRGTLLAYRYLGKQGTGKGGVIVNLAGIDGIEPLAPAPTHCAAQHAIVGLSRSFGHPMHVQPTGVRVVQLMTGFTQTDFLKDIEKKAMTAAMGTALAEVITKAKKQKPEACGQAVVHLVRCAKSGSAWMVDGSRLFELNIPNWETYKTLAAQYI